MDRKRSREEWDAVVAEFKASGLNLRQFCDGQGIKVSSLDYHVNRKKHLDAKRKQRAGTNGGHKPASVSGPVYLKAGAFTKVGAAQQITISLANGTTLSVPMDAPMVVIQNILRGLNG